MRHHADAGARSRREARKAAARKGNAPVTRRAFQSLECASAGDARRWIEEERKRRSRIDAKLGMSRPDERLLPDHGASGAAGMPLDEDQIESAGIEFIAEIPAQSGAQLEIHIGMAADKGSEHIG